MTGQSLAKEIGNRKIQFAAALKGSGVAPQKFMRVALTAVQIDRQLQNCDPESFLTACMKAAQDGLLPDGRDAAFVAFDGKVTYMPMIGGIRKKVRRSGEITSWDVTAVHAKDEFEFELGDHPFIRHKPWMPPALRRGEEEDEENYAARLLRHIDPGPMTYVYSVAKLKGGDLSRDVMTRLEVELVRDTYARKNKQREFSPAWRKSFDEMAKKTCARRHSKQLPMSSDLVALLHRDDESYDLQERSERPRVQAPRALSDRLEKLAAFDPESGEIEDSGQDSTPLPSGAASEDSSVLGSGAEEAAQQSETAAVSLPSDAPQGEPEITPAGSPGPPGAHLAPEAAPGGQPELIPTAELISTPDLEAKGKAMAKRGLDSLENWITHLPPDDMARVSLGQVSAWRAIAAKVRK
jgi:recombination protein RecT